MTSSMYTALLLVVTSCLTGAVFGEKKPNVIIDTDAGADDALAILMMLSPSSPVNVIAITCVTGNTGVVNVTRNVLTVLRKVGRLDIPVYVGAKQGLVYEEISDGYFGYDGFGNWDENDKPSIFKAKTLHAARALGQIISSKPGEVTLLCIGPLTNLALAIHIFPNVLNVVKKVVILGGSYKGGGNIKPGAEFNMYADPEAAAFVFTNVPKSKKNLIRLLPLETANENAFTLHEREDLSKFDTTSVKFLDLIERVYLPKATEWAPFDAMAASVIMWPSLVTNTEPMYVLVETCGKLARGAMFVQRTTKKVNVNVIKGFNKKEFKKHLDKVLHQELSIE